MNWSTRVRRSFAALLLVSLLPLLSGCPGSSTEDLGTATMRKPTYVGPIDGSDALIALVVDGHQVVGYVCSETRWADRTGWFNTELADAKAQQGALKQATSAAGHLLQATIHGSMASGTLRFADGAVHSFSAAAVPSEGPAGLYEAHSSEGQIGLVIAEDGRAAGAARITNGGGTGASATAQPVAVGNPLAAGTTGIAVTVPTLGSRTLLPVLPKLVSIDRLGPTLYVLVHGMNHPVGGDPSLVDTPQQSRTEWHLDFIQGLLGGRDPNGGAHLPMFNFAGQAVTQGNFMDPARLPPFDSFVAERDIAERDAIATHFVTLDPAVGDATAGTPGTRPPQFSAFITYRDASGGLVESGRRIANQTFVALRWYEQHFRVTPKLVYLTQSFGGLAARFVLSNPTQAQIDAPGVPSMNVDRIRLSDEDRRRMDYVRDRVMYFVSLGTPHEGSFMADLFVPLQQQLQALERSLDGNVANLQAGLRPLGTMLAQTGAIGATLLQPTQSAARTMANVRAGLAEASRQLNGRALRDLRHDFWVRVNNGPLHPQRARRSAASPIPGAGGQLIPVYAAGARTPGGRAFTAPELAVFQRLQSENSKEQAWMINTMVTDLLIHALRVNEGGFGRSTQGIYAGFDEQLDRRQRVVDGSALARQTAAQMASSVSPWFAEQFGAGVEGVVNFVLGDARRVALPIYLDRNGGSFDLGATARLRVPAFQCTADDGRVFRIRLDLGQLLTQMRTVFGSLGAAADALATQNLNGALRVLLASPPLAADIVGWFVREWIARAVPSGRCALPGVGQATPVAAVLATLNLANWTIVDVIDEFPAPRWRAGNDAASDDEIDSDGVVGFESAVGFSLGTQTPLFFDHARFDATGAARGSWYRIFDSPVERECHGMQHQWSVGDWVLRRFAAAGPVPAAGDLSVFP